MITKEFTIQLGRIDGNYKGQLERLQKANPTWVVVDTKKHEGYMDVTIREDQVEPLAEYVQYHRDGEAWIATKIFPKEANGKRITSAMALAYSGWEEAHDYRMGECQYAKPTIQSIVGAWVVQQSGYANV